MKSALSHRLVTDPAELPSLRADWDRLAVRSRNPLLGFDWFHACAMTIHADDPLRVIVVYEGDNVEAIAPLAVVTRSSGNPRLEILGTSTLYEPAGFLYSSDESAAYLLDIALGMRLPLCLLRIPAGNSLCDATSRLGASRGLKIVRDAAPAAYLELGTSWEALVARLSSNRRYDFKRKRKRAEALGPVTIEDIRPSTAEFSRCFEKAVTIEHASWKGKQGSSLQMNAALRRFFEVYLREACERGACRFFFLKVGDEFVAMQIAVEADDACWILKQGYNDDYAKLSPGVQLAHRSLRCCIESGVKRFEFLGSEEGWQSSWPIERHAFSMLLLIPYSFAGLREFCGAVVSAVRSRSASG